MTSIFDGMTGVLDGVFGAPVLVSVPGGGSHQVSGVFRREPTEVAGDDGEPVIISAPTLRIRRDAVREFGRGCEVRPSIEPGSVYRVVNQIQTASPAADGYLMVELEFVR